MVDQKERFQIKGFVTKSILTKNLNSYGHINMTDMQ
jgi:hypothetical protein